jgi:hypothetical protein
MSWEGLEAPAVPPRSAGAKISVGRGQGFEPGANRAGSPGRLASVERLHHLRDAEMVVCVSDYLRALGLRDEASLERLTEAAIARAHAWLRRWPADKHTAAALDGLHEVLQEFYGDAAAVGAPGPRSLSRVRLAFALQQLGAPPGGPAAPDWTPEEVARLLPHAPAALLLEPQPLETWSERFRALGARIRARMRHPFTSSAGPAPISPTR